MIRTRTGSISGAITAQNVNAPDVTLIQGQGRRGDKAVRCAYVGEGTQLDGFTLTNGHTSFGGSVAARSGGEAWCELSAVVSNCVITSNRASYKGVGQDRSNGAKTFSKV